MRTFPGANISSDHDLMMTTFKLKLKAKCCPKKLHIHFDQEKLKDPEVTKVFQAQVGGKLAALNLTDSVQKHLQATSKKFYSQQLKRFWVKDERKSNHASQMKYWIYATRGES